MGTITIPSGGAFGYAATQDLTVDQTTHAPNNVAFTGTVTIPDGALAIADTAGLQTALNAKAPAASVATHFVRKVRTAGNLVLNNMAWTDVDNTELDMVLTGAAGQVIEAGLSLFVVVGATELYFDIVTVVAGSPVNSISSGSADRGFPGLVFGANFTQGKGHSIPYVLQAGDISAGTVTLRVRYRTQAAVDCTLVSVAGSAAIAWATNRG